MKRLWLFLLLSMPLGAQVSNPSIIPVTSAPTGSCSVALPIQLKTPDGTLYTCQSGTWGVIGGGMSTAEKWQRQGVVIAPIAADLTPQSQEPSAMLDSSPEVLTGYSQVVKMTWTCGWWPASLGGNGIGICGGESPDGVTPPTRTGADPIIADHARSYLLPVRIGGNLVLYAYNMLTSGGIDIYTGSTLAGLTLAHSNVLACGSNGTEIVGSGNFAIWPNNGDWTSSNWSMLYECQTSIAPNNYVGWLATSSNAGVTWTKSYTTPVVGQGSGVTCGGSCNTAGGFYVYRESSGTLDMWATAGTVPTHTPYIWHFVSPNNGQSWTADSAPAMTASVFDEGVNSSAGQIADPYLLPLANSTIMYYEGLQNSCSAQAICPYPTYVKAAIINEPISTLVGQTQSDGGPNLARPVFEVNGVPISYNGVINLTAGTGVYPCDNGNGLIVFETSPCYQDYATFVGSSGTLLSSYTTSYGKTFALNNESGVSPTMPELSGLNSAVLPSGGATTYGDVVDSLTPSSADYTVAGTFTYATSVTGSPLATLFSRQSLSAQMSYIFQCQPVASACQLFKAVSGTTTQLGSNYPVTWNLGASITLALKIAGTTITPYIGGVAQTPQTDSAISAAGVAGFRITGGSSVTVTNFYVK